MNSVWYPFDVFPADLRQRLASAQGWWLHADDGRRFVDAISSWWVNIHGHVHPRLVKALADQAARMDQVMFSGFSHQPAEALAEWLCSRYDGMEKTFFSDDGSTAVEVALKMAIQYHHAQGRPRHKILALKGAYHGDTFGAMSAAGTDDFTTPFAPLFFQVDRVGFAKAARLDAPLTDLDREELAKAQEMLAGGQVAAFIFEPLVQGAAGMRLVKKAYLEALAALCRQHGTLLIADEVMTGFYRTGSLFACDQLSFRPDLACLSKGLTGGFIPLGITLASSAIYQTLSPADYRLRFLHGHSFSANPLACAVALESCQMLEEAAALEARQQVFGWMAGLGQTLASHPAVETLRHVGGMLAFELALRGEKGYFAEIREQAYRFFIENGVLLRPLGRTLYLLPPHSCPDAEAQNLAGEKLIEFCNVIAQQGQLK